MKFFKNTTWGMPVIMGRKTFESMRKPLRGRTNIVVSRHPEKFNRPENTQVDDQPVWVKSIDEAFAASAATDARECYVIGGGELYRQTIPVAHRIYLTRVLATFEGDTFFPEWDRSGWELTNSTEFPKDAKHAWPYRFEIWERS